MEFDTFFWKMKNNSNFTPPFIPHKATQNVQKPRYC
jgi:hypothetical protein